MPTIDDQFRELLARAPQEGGSEDPSTGMDTFLADAAEPNPITEAVPGLEDLWGRGLPETPVETSEADLESLFMSGAEARSAAAAQGHQSGPMFPVLAEPPPDFQQEEQIQFDTDMTDTHHPNNAVRWVVGREDAPPAAPPMRTGANQQDGRVVGSFRGGRFEHHPRAPQTTRVTHQTSPSTPVEGSIPTTAPAPLPPTLYDHLLED